MTTTVETFIYLQRDIEQTFERLQTTTSHDYENLRHHLICTIDDLEEIHRLLPSNDENREKFPSFNEREEILRRIKLAKEKIHPLSNENEFIRKQDEHLDEIHHSIVSLKNLSKNIHQEIDDHLRVLDNLGTEMSESQNRVENLNRQTKNFLQRSSDGVGGHTFLFSVAVLLFLLIVILILFF